MFNITQSQPPNLGQTSPFSVPPKNFEANPIEQLPLVPLWTIMQNFQGMLKNLEEKFKKVQQDQAEVNPMRTRLQELQERVDRLEPLQKVDELKAQVVTLKGLVEQLKGEKDSHKQQVDQLTSRVTLLENSNKRLWELFFGNMPTEETFNAQPLQTLSSAASLQFLPVSNPLSTIEGHWTTDGRALDVSTVPPSGSIAQTTQSSELPLPSKTPEQPSEPIVLPNRNNALPSVSEPAENDQTREKRTEPPSSASGPQKKRNRTDQNSSSSLPRSPGTVQPKLILKLRSLEPKSKAENKRKERPSHSSPLTASSPPVRLVSVHSNNSKSPHELDDETEKTKERLPLSQEEKERFASLFKQYLKEAKFSQELQVKFDLSKKQVYSVIKLLDPELLEKTGSTSGTKWKWIGQ